MNKEDYFKYYIQGSDHYLIPKDVFKELFNEMLNWKEEAKELKKQLEEYKDKINWYENFEVNKTIDKLRLKHNAQQKEFMKFLEDNWNNLKEYLNEGTFYYKTGNGEYTTEMVSNRINGLDTLRKMQELEKGSDNNVKD